MTRRTITAATAAALGLLGAILGTANAVIAGMTWTHSGLTATAGGVPPSDSAPPASSCILLHPADRAAAGGRDQRLAIRRA